MTFYGTDYPEPVEVDPFAPGEVVDDEQPPPEDAAARARRLFPRLDWHALWADDTEEEWIHEPLIPARRSVVIYSPPKVGKSLLMLEMAVAISRGAEFLGHCPQVRRRVLYVDFENDPRGDVRSRLQAMGFGPDDLDHLDYLSYPTMAGLDTERGALELLEAVRAYRSELVVIDTVSRAVDGEENSNDTWLGLYRHTGLKLKQAGVAMVRLDHTGKDETKGQRGGSAKSGDVDAIWRLSKVTDERFRLECTDSRLQITTKSLQLYRHRIPRLHHTVEVLGAMTDREAKVAHLVALADANGLPAHANRDTLRAFAKTRGLGLRTDTLREVIRRRKADPPPWVNTSPGQAEIHDLPERSGRVTSPESNGSEHKSADPPPWGQPGSAGQADSDPGAAVRSTAPVGQAVTPSPETGRCGVCGKPLHRLDVGEGATRHAGCVDEAAS